MIRVIKEKLFFYGLLIVSSIAGASSVNELDVSTCKKAVENYHDLMKNPFTMSVGVSISQTHYTNNTLHPKFVLEKLYNVSQKQGKEKAKSWLAAKERCWYLLGAMPEYTCENGHKIDPGSIEDSNHKQKILDDILSHMDNKSFSITKCPTCDTNKIIMKTKSVDSFNEVMEDKLVELVKNLDVDLQMLNGLPTVRLSIEIADILQQGTRSIDETKLRRLIKFINKLGNPMLFFHHYANPQSYENLFETEESILWFSSICATIMKHLPNITHVCPVSQPVGFAFRMARGELSPFELTQSRSVFLENIIRACAQASLEMKNVAADQMKAGKRVNSLKVLVSHQWKIMKVKHTSILDIRYSLESLVATIADSIYNGSFVDSVTPYIDYFDGIALSVYPSLKFDMWTPQGSNVDGTIDYEGSLESVIATSKAFPKKDIYIVEAGCNTRDQKMKIEYIDKMTCVCKKAVRDLRISLKTLYFWGITNDPDFYMEWNSLKGSTNFGPYDTMEKSSINVAGKYIQQILKKNLLMYDEDGKVIGNVLQKLLVSENN